MYTLGTFQTAVFLLCLGPIYLVSRLFKGKYSGSYQPSAFMVFRLLIFKAPKVNACWFPKPDIMETFPSCGVPSASSAL